MSAKELSQYPLIVFYLDGRWTSTKGFCDMGAARKFALEHDGIVHDRYDEELERLAGERVEKRLMRDLDRVQEASREISVNGH